MYCVIMHVSIYVICKIAGLKGDQGDTGLIGPKGDPGKFIKFWITDYLSFNFT